MKKGLIFILLLSMLLTGCQAPTEEVEVPRSSIIAEEKPAILPLEETDADHPGVRAVCVRYHAKESTFVRPLS